MALVLLSLLGACATTGGQGASDYGSLMSQAESAVSAGRVDAALVAFADAAKADPTKKEPWVRSAQLQFDKSNYARAIVAAEEVLQRDPDDMVADGILTVSGFRIANHSLQRLQGRGALSSETARREAETLAGTLKATMGDDILAPEEPQKATAARRARPAPRASAAPARPAASSASSESGGQSGADPFKNIGGN
ncbi:tetratricopeptide repeat protein [Luteimonas sp. R10]|uniref:tetratricopeptide repeat protein n=1 Tax=Luteimonas sp. R10 TaxID=3108176 RepID=UPI0030911712|nr:tetratricopeptide repeat protein [Luteimonas sp. R10]